MTMHVDPVLAQAAAFTPPPPGRKPPPFAVIEQLPAGLIEHPNLASVIERVAELLAGRPFVQVFTYGTYRGLDTFAMSRVYTEDLNRRPVFLCAIVAGDDPPIPFLDAALERRRFAAAGAPRVVRTTDPNSQQA